MPCPSHRCAPLILALALMTSSACVFTQTPEEAPASNTNNTTGETNNTTGGTNNTTGGTNNTTGGTNNTTGGTNNTTGGACTADTGCAQGEACCDGVCAQTSTGRCPGVPECDESTPCMGEETCCEGVCVDTSTSGEHCGACGFACGGESVCQGGVCACPALNDSDGLIRAGYRVIATGAMIRTEPPPQLIALPCPDNNANTCSRAEAAPSYGLAYATGDTLTVTLLDAHGGEIPGVSNTLRPGDFPDLQGATLRSYAISSANGALLAIILWRKADGNYVLRQYQLGSFGAALPTIQFTDLTQTIFGRDNLIDPSNKVLDFGIAEGTIPGTNTKALLVMSVEDDDTAKLKSWLYYTTTPNAQALKRVKSDDVTFDNAVAPGLIVAHAGLITTDGKANLSFGVLIPALSKSPFDGLLSSPDATLMFTQLEVVMDAETASVSPAHEPLSLGDIGGAPLPFVAQGAPRVPQPLLDYETPAREGGAWSLFGLRPEADGTGSRWITREITSGSAPMPGGVTTVYNRADMFAYASAAAQGVGRNAALGWLESPYRVVDRGFEQTIMSATFSIPEAGLPQFNSPRALDRDARLQTLTMAHDGAAYGMVAGAVLSGRNGVELRFYRMMNDETAVCWLGEGTMRSMP